VEAALTASIAFAPALASPGPAGVAAVACRAWKIVPSPVVENASLGAVSATSSTDVWTVGSYLDQSGSIIEHWDGRAWTLVPHPVATLYSVEAISPDDVWAVGGSGVIQHWDGAAWKIVPSPKPGTSRVLLGVSATSATDVWAGGYYVGPDGSRPLALHWGGVRWTLVPVPDGSPYGTNAFFAIAAVAPNDAWGVGDQDVSGGFNLQPLAEHWDGTEWTPVDVPPIPTGYSNVLNGVDGSSTTDVWAVGTYSEGTQGIPLVEHWDGTAWTQVDMSSLQNNNGFSGVAALSPADAWAVGASAKTAPTRPFTEHWDGSAWSVVASPNPANASLLGVAMVSSKDIWAVGADFDDGLAKFVPMIMHSRGPC
jgi:hypothetical protein